MRFLSSDSVARLEKYHHIGGLQSKVRTMLTNKIKCNKKKSWWRVHISQVKCAISRSGCCLQLTCSLLKPMGEMGKGKNMGSMVMFGVGGGSSNGNHR